MFTNTLEQIKCIINCNSTNRSQLLKVKCQKQRLQERATFLDRGSGLSDYHHCVLANHHNPGPLGHRHPLSCLRHDSKTHDQNLHNPRRKAAGNDDGETPDRPGRR